MRRPKTSKQIPFDYLIPKANIDKKAQAEKFVQMHVEEIKRRTRMLQELKYDKRYIKKRIKQNIRWEFELLGLPQFYNYVDKIIDQTYIPKSPSR